MKSKKKHIMFVCTEDWFFQSHFLPLNKAALHNAPIEISLLCSKSTKQASENLEKKGINLYNVNFARQSTNPFKAFALLWQLITLFRAHKPDIIHFISLKPVLVGGIATLFSPKTAKIYHVTGLGSLAEGSSPLVLIARHIAFRLLPFYVRRQNSKMLYENPDDLSFLQDYGVIPPQKTTLLGGAGIDPDYFIPHPLPQNDMPHIAYVGRMIWTKGVDILVEAHQILEHKGIILHLDLYGAPDLGNPKSITPQTLQDWQNHPHITWHGQTNDILKVWQNADIAVVPTRTREGMPRAMLEAASCARPLIVTDIPGCRHFVRHGIEGYNVPPENAQALADALEILAKNAPLREKMGQAARQRVLQGYTEANITKTVQALYQDILTD